MRHVWPQMGAEETDVEQSYGSLSRLRSAVNDAEPT